MNTLRLFAATFFVAALFAVSAFAQVNPAGASQPGTAGRIAVINTTAFDDPKGGITKYTNAMNTLENEFKPVNTELQTMVAKYQTLGTEIQNLQKNANPQVPISQSTVQTKIDEYGKLERDIKFKQEDAKARFDSRQNTLLGPILKDIGNAMQEYAKAKGYILILDIAKMANADLILALDEKADVTKDFITFYNARPAGAAASTAAAPK